MPAPIPHTKSPEGVTDISESELDSSTYVPYLQCIAFILAPLIAIYYYHTI